VPAPFLLARLLSAPRCFVSACFLCAERSHAAGTPRLSADGLPQRFSPRRFLLDLHCMSADAVSATVSPTPLQPRRRRLRLARALQPARRSHFQMPAISPPIFSALLIAPRCRRRYFALPPLFTPRINSLHAVRALRPPRFQPPLRRFSFRRASFNRGGRRASLCTQPPLAACFQPRQRLLQARRRYASCAILRLYGLHLRCRIQCRFDFAWPGCARRMFF